MKGFLGAFLIFIFWASGGIYYVSKTHEKGPELESIESKEVVREEFKGMETSQPTYETKLEMTEVQIDPELTDSVFNSGSSGNSQLLAAELKKSISISDTIDINQGEPALSYESEIALFSEKFVNSNLFYPRYTNSSELILDKKLINYANELKELLKESPDKKVTIIGHTDNIGNARDNFVLALKKARQVKWYLTAMRGIPRSFITATSRGEEEPIESNNSKWGRNKNDRIEIIVD